MREQDGGLAAVLNILVIYNKNISDKHSFGFYSENLSTATQMSMSMIITSTGTCVHIDKFAGNCLLANICRIVSTTILDTTL